MKYNYFSSGKDIQLVGNLSFFILCFQLDQKKPGGNLKEELRTIIPLLEDMRRQKVERKNQFVEILAQLQKMSNEIFGLRENNYNVAAYETNMSLHRLEELHRELRDLQDEKVQFPFFIHLFPNANGSHGAILTVYI